MQLWQKACLWLTAQVESQQFTQALSIVHERACDDCDILHVWAENEAEAEADMQNVKIFTWDTP